MNADSTRRQRRRRILRRVLLVLVILLLVLMGVGLWAVRALPGIAEARIGQLTNTRVEMGAFDFHRDASVSIDGLVAYPGAGQPAHDDAILRAGRIHVHFSPRSLLSLSPRLTEIRIDDFIVNALFDMDSGRWNVEDLRIKKPPGKSGNRLPTVALQRGTLRYSKASEGKSEVVMSVPVEASFGFVEEPRPGYRFGIKTARLSSGYGQSHLDGFWREGELTIAGGLSSMDIPSLERAWAADVIAAQLTYDSNDNYALDVSVKNAHNKQSPEVDAFRRLVPESLTESGPLSTFQSFFTRYRPSGVVSQVTLNARGNFKTLAQSEVTGSLICDDVSICDRRFPYAIDHLTGRIDFTQSSIVLNQLSGTHGDVDLVIEGSTKGFGQNRFYQYRVTSDNMILDSALYAALQPGQKRLWDAFQPRGVIGVDYRSSKSPSTDKRAHIAVRLQHVAAAYERFPYPLEGLTGELYIDKETIVASDIVSRAGSRWIKVDGRITQRNTGSPVYYVAVDGNDIPLDAVLARALPGQYRSLYDQFDANGAAAVRAKVFSVGDANGIGSISFVADISARTSSLKPRRLPVTLSDTRADISITPDSLNVKKLTGRYDGGTVSLSCNAWLSQGALPRLELKAAAEGVMLDGKIVEALPESLRLRVAPFDPQGRVNLAVDVKRVDSNGPVDYTIGVECLGGSIRHERFMYPLQNVRGKLTLTPGHVTFDAIQASPAVPLARDLQSTLRLNGHLGLTDAGAELGSFTVAARNVPFTDELANVLAGALGQTYRDLSPQGSFDLDLTIPRISKVAPDDIHMDFRGKAGLKAHDVRLAGSATELQGNLAVEGSYGAKAGLRSARVELDARRLTVREKVITDLKGGLVFDPNAESWSASEFVGNCYGGRVTGHLELATAEESELQYLLQMAFHRVDLQQFLAAGKATETTERDYSSGTMNASLSLGARLGDATTRLGACRVDVVDMRVGRVSPLFNFLTVLQLNEPTDYTFDRMLIESYLKGDTLMIEKLDISGRNAAFVGSGTVNTSSGDVNLILMARGKRLVTARPGIFESLAEGLGGAVVRMEVTGKTDNPSITTKALPLIEDSLRILGSPR